MATTARKPAKRRAAASTAPVLPQPFTEIFRGDLEDLAQHVLSLKKTRYTDHILQKAGPHGVSFGEVARLCREGNAEYAERYHRAASALQLQQFEPRVTYQLDTEGQYFDTATFLSGQPECWLNEGDYPVETNASLTELGTTIPIYIRH
jgi:hypothetical protein